ncbi:hypothetical protein WA577_001036, partial [Blastocystis sp. JDR]
MRDLILVLVILLCFDAFELHLLFSTHHKQEQRLSTSWEESRMGLESTAAFRAEDISEPKPTQSPPVESATEWKERIETHPSDDVIPPREIEVRRPDRSHTYSGSIIFKPSESGLGNNLYGLTSAFVVAALTNRKLYYSGNYAMHTIFTFYDYWNSTIERYRGVPPSRDAIIAYNKCFNPRSTIAMAFATQPLASLIKQKTLLFSTNCPLFLFLLQNPDNLQRLA